MAILDPNDPIHKKDLADKAKMSEERRLVENKPFSLANSQAAYTAPERVPDKAVREEDKAEVEKFHKKAVNAAKKNPEFLEQMPTIFDLLGGLANAKELEDYSYQADLYDAVPKFNWAPVKREIGKYLPVMKREFKHQKGDFFMELTPARVDDKDHYPGGKEELIEMVLVQMAFEVGQPMMGGYYGVKFSLYELRKRLKEEGHTFSIIQIKQGLYIMSGSIMTIKTDSDKGETQVREALFSSLGLRTWDDWKELGRTSECFVRFNSLHVEALKNKKWRLLNGSKVMELDGGLSRWLYKRMAREWTGAEFNKSMHLKLSSIIRDSGMGESNQRKSRMKVEAVFNELKSKNHIFTWASSKEIGGQKGTKVLDVIYDIKPSLSFAKEMKRFNQLKRDSKKLDILEPKR